MKIETKREWMKELLGGMLVIIVGYSVAIMMFAGLGGLGGALADAVGVGKTISKLIDKPVTCMEIGTLAGYIVGMIFGFIIVIAVIFDVVER
jgi:hypothetical protein